MHISLSINVKVSSSIRLPKFGVGQIAPVCSFFETVVLTVSTFTCITSECTNPVDSADVKLEKNMVFHLDPGGGGGAIIDVDQP